MKSPAFRLYVDDFYAGTAEMSQEEVGAYIRLLCHQWNRGSIPVEPEKQQRLAGGLVSVDVLLKFPVWADGLRRNERMEIERKKQTDYSEDQRKKGIASGAARRNEQSTNNGSTPVHPNTNPGSTDNGTEPQPKTNLPFPVSVSVLGSEAVLDVAANGTGNARAPGAPLAPPSAQKPPKEPKPPFRPPTQAEMEQHAVKIEFPPSEIEKFFAHHETRGWTLPPQHKVLMKSWQQAMVTWRNNAHKFGENGFRGHRQTEAERRRDMADPAKNGGKSDDPDSPTPF